MSRLLSSFQSRRRKTRYAKAVIDLVKLVDYDGIDFDWEYPDNPKEVAGFERLCATFSRRT